MNSAIADAAIGCFTTVIQKTCDEVGSPYSICPPDESVGDPIDDEEAEEEEPRSKCARHSNNQFIRKAK